MCGKGPGTAITGTEVHLPSKDGILPSMHVPGLKSFTGTARGFISYLQIIYTGTSPRWIGFLFKCKCCPKTFWIHMHNEVTSSGYGSTTQRSGVTFLFCHCHRFSTWTWARHLLPMCLCSPSVRREQKDFHPHRVLSRCNKTYRSTQSCSYVHYFFLVSLTKLR